VLTSRFKITAH